MNLQIRPLKIRDCYQVCDWIESDRDLLLWGGPYFDFPLEPSAFQPLIDQHSGIDPLRECWAVENTNGLLIGSFQLSYNARTGQAELGRVILDPAVRGKGLAAGLISFAIEKAFSRQSVHRLELRVYDFNEAAVATYLRAGFVLEGTRRESVRFENDYWNTQIMGLLRSELS